MFNDSLILKIEYDTRAAMRAVKDLQRESDKLGDIDLKATAARKSNSGSGNTSNQSNSGSSGVAQAAAILSVGALLRRNLLSSFDPLIKSNQQLSNALSSLDKAKQDKQTATATAAGTVEHDVKINLDALGFADTVAERLQRVSIELDAKEAKKILSEFGSAANREAIIAKEGLSKSIALELKAIKLAFSDTLKGLNKKQEAAVSAVAAGTATPEQRDTFREVAAAFQDGLATFSGAVEDSKTGIISATQNLESFADRTGGTFESTTNLFASAIEGNVVAERELASKVLQLDGSILGLTNASDKLAGKYKERGVAGNSLLADSRVMKHFGDQRDIIGGIGSTSQARFAESDPKLIAVFDKLRALESKRETIVNDPTASLGDIRSQTTELDKQIGRVNAVLRDELNYRSDRLASLRQQEERRASTEASYQNVLKNRPFDQPLRDIQGQRMAPQLESSNPRTPSSGSEIVLSPGGALVLIKRIIDDLNDFSFVVGFATKEVSRMARAFALAQGTNRGTGKPITALPGWSPDLAKLPTLPIAGYAQLIESTTKLLKEASDGYALALYHSAREIQLAAQEMQPLAGIKGSVRGLVQAYRSFILGELAQIGRLDVFTSPDRAKQLQKGKTDLRLAAMSIQNEAKDVPGAFARRGKTEVLKPVDNIAASAKELETLAVNTVTSGIKSLAVTVLEMLREADAIARQETTRFAQRNQRTIDVRAETIVDGFSAANTPALRGETALRKLPYQALEVAASDDTALAIHRLGVSAVEVAQKLNVVSGLLAVKNLGHVDSLATKIKDSSVLAQSPGDVMGGVAAAFAFEAAGAIKTALDNSGITDQVKTEVVRGFKSIMSNLATAMADRATRDSEILVNAINKVNQAKTKLIAPEGKLSAAATRIQQGTSVSTALQKVPIASLRQLEGSPDNSKLAKDDLISRLVTSGKSVDEMVDALNKLQVTQITAEVNKLYEALNGGGTQGLKELQKSTNSPAVAKAAEAIQNPSKKGQKLGRDIADGLSLGLNPEMVSLAGVGLIASIFKAMNSEAETASPSKKAIRLARNILDGLKIGLSEQSLFSEGKSASSQIFSGLEAGKNPAVKAVNVLSTNSDRTTDGTIEREKYIEKKERELRNFQKNLSTRGVDGAGIALSALSQSRNNKTGLIEASSDKGKTLGFLNYRERENDIDIKSIGTNQQIKGAGTELVNELKRIALALNKSISVDAPTADAMPFYKKQGFKPIDPNNIYAGLSMSVNEMGGNKGQNLGHDITNGLNVGLDAEKVKSTGAELVNSVFVAMNKEAETASPSKRAIRLASDILKGLTIGMSKQDMSAAGKSVSAQIISGLKSGNLKEVEAAYLSLFGGLTQKLRGFDINKTIGTGGATGIQATTDALKQLEAEVLVVGKVMAQNGLGLKSTNFESALKTLKEKVTGTMKQLGGALQGTNLTALQQILDNIESVEQKIKSTAKTVSNQTHIPFTAKSAENAALTGSVKGTEYINVKTTAKTNTEAYLNAEENQAKIQRITQALGSSMYQLGGTAGAAIAGTLEPVISVLSEAGVLSGAFNKALFGVAGVATLVTFQFLNLGRESERLNARFAVIGESGAQQLRKMVALANDLGVSFQSIAETKIQVKASLVGVSYKVDADAIAKNLAVVTRGFSLNKDQSDRTRMGFTQGLSKGTVSMEELKQQLSEAIPGFMGDFAKSLGLTVEQTMKEVAKGGVSGEQYVKALEFTAARAEPGVAAGKDTLDAKVIILQNNATVLGMQLGQTALALTKWATTGLTWVVQGFSQLAPIIGTVLIGLTGGFITALALMTFALAKSAAQALASSAVGSAAITAFTNPIGLWVAGISLVVVGLTEIFKDNSTQLDKQLKDLADSFDETRTNIKKKVKPEASELALPQTNNNLGDSLKDFFVSNFQWGGKLDKQIINTVTRPFTGKEIYSAEETLTPSQKQANERTYKRVGEDNKKLEAQGILSPAEVRAAASELQKYNAALEALRAKRTAAQQFRPNDKAAIEGIDAEIKAMETARDAYSTAKLGANNIGRLEADIESRSAVIAQLEGQVRNKEQDKLLQKNKELNNQQKERLRLIQDEIALQQSLVAAAYARAKAGAEDTADKNANESNIKQSALARQQATFSKTSEAFGVDDANIKLEDAQKNAARLTTQYQEMMSALDKEPQGLALLTQLGKSQLSDVTKADLAAIEALVPGVSNKESLAGLKEFAGKLGEAKNVQNELSKAGLETAQAELQAAEAAKKLLESLRDVADVMDAIKGAFDGFQVDLDIVSLQRQTAIESSRNPFNEGDNTDTRLKKEAIDTLGTEIEVRKDFVRQINSLGNSLSDAENRFIASFTNGIDPRDLKNYQLGDLSARINNYKASGKPVSSNVTDYIGGLKEAGTANRDVASKELEIAKARNDMQKGVADAMKKLKDAQEKFSEALKSMLESLQDALESISDELKTLQREITDKSFDLNLQSQIQKVREAFGNGFDESFFAQIVKAGEDFYKAIRDANNKAADGQDKATKAIRDKNKEIRKIEEGFEKSYKAAQKELAKAQADLSNAQSASNTNSPAGNTQDQSARIAAAQKSLDSIQEEYGIAAKTNDWRASGAALNKTLAQFPELTDRLRLQQEEVNRRIQKQITTSGKIDIKSQDKRPFGAGSVVDVPGVDSTKWIKGTGDAAKNTAASLTALDSEAKDTTTMYGEAQGVLAKVKDSNLKFAEGQNKVAQTIGQIADLDKRKAISDLDTALRNAAKAAKELAEALPLTILQLGQSIEEFGLGGRARSPGEQLKVDRTSVEIQTLELGKRIDDTEKSVLSLSLGKMNKEQYDIFVKDFLSQIDTLGLSKDKVKIVKDGLQGGFDDRAKQAEAMKPVSALLIQKKADLSTAVFGANSGADERYQKTLAQGRADVASSKRSTFDTIADSPYFNGSDVSQRAKVYAELTEMQETYSDRLSEYVKKQYALGIDSFTASELFIKAENAKKDSLRQSTDVLGLGLKSLGESSLTNLFSTLFTDVAGGAKTAGEAFMDFARSVVTGIAQMAAQMLAKFAIFQLMKAFFPGAGGAIGSAASGGGGGFLGSLLGGVLGNKANGGTILNQAMGGTIPSMAFGGTALELGKTLPNLAFGGEIDNYAGGGIVKKGGALSWIFKLLFPMFGGLASGESPAKNPLLSVMFPLFSKLFGFGAFATGGTVGNYAMGGAIGKAMERERSQSGGKQPVLAVLHSGEEVLSTLNQDAQIFRGLKQSGAWDSIKNNYAFGGTVGLGNSAQSTDTNGGSGSSTTNVFITGATDEQSFRDNRSRVALTTKRRYG